MDGFDTNTNVIVIAATNRPDVLDPALVRPGRFDRQVILDAPDIKGRIDILKVHVKGKPLAEDVNLEAVAKITPGASGADLANIVNEAAILAARRGKRRITELELEDATERMMLGGPERRSRVMTPYEKRLTAYHEAGHAIVGTAMPKADPVHKITIVPRGQAGGYTLFLPEDDQHYRTVQQFESMMAYAMGGRAAEELTLVDFTTGASNDIQQVTRMARAMVTRFGMSNRLGTIQLGEVQEMIFLGREISEQRNYSDETARIIDEEVKRLVDIALERARTVLRANVDVLHELANKLLEVETLGGEEMRAILGKVNQYQTGSNGHTPTPPSDSSVIIAPGTGGVNL
jgi:cell division protease FtsH